MWANERIRPRFIDRIYSFSRESFMADRTGLERTRLHVGEKYLSSNHIAEKTIRSATPEILGFFNTMTQHFFGALSVLNYMHTASYELLLKPKESARCHQTLSAWVGSGDKTRLYIAVDSQSL